MQLHCIVRSTGVLEMQDFTAHRRRFMSVKMAPHPPLRTHLKVREERRWLKSQGELLYRLVVKTA